VPNRHRSKSPHRLPKKSESKIADTNLVRKEEKSPKNNKSQSSNGNQACSDQEFWKNLLENYEIEPMSHDEVVEMLRKCTEQDP